MKGGRKLLVTQGFMKFRIPMLAAFALLSTKAPAMAQVKNVLGEGNAPVSEWDQRARCQIEPER